MNKVASKPFELVTEYTPAGDQPRAISALIDGLEAGEAYQTLLGATGTGKTFTVANLINTLQRPSLILAPNKTLAAQLYSEMRDFFPNNAVEYFVSYYDYYQPEAYVPSSDTYIEKDASINDHIEQMRLSATKALLERNDVIIVGTVSTIYGLGDPEAYHKMVLHLRSGDAPGQRLILKRLAEMQYVRSDAILSRGQFRVRGDVIDIYPAEEETMAVRVELFGDEIDRVSLFDPLTGATTDDIGRFTVYPKTHYATPRETLLKAVDNIKVELEERLEVLQSQNKLLEAQRLSERTRFDLEMMRELGYCSGIENYSRYLSGRKPGEPPPTFIDYLPANALLFIDESHVSVPQLGAMYKGDRSRKENLVEYGFRLPSALDNRPLKFEEFEGLMPQTVFVSATPGPYELEKSDVPIDQVVRPTGLVDPEIEVRPVSMQVDDLLSEISKTVLKNERVLVTTLTKRMAEDLTDYLSEHDVKVRYLHSDIDTVERVEIIRDLRMGMFDVLVGINLLREGLDLPEVSLVAILDADKEGFLRSTRSLVQTIGRAARNINGRVIMYGDTITKSMKGAIEETDRRRIRQHAYNVEHNITPKSVQKAVRDIIDGVYRANEGTSKRSRHSQGRRGENAYDKERNNLDTHDVFMSPKEIAKEIKKLEKEMAVFARELEFEKAAEIRDQIRELRIGLISAG